MKAVTLRRWSAVHTLSSLICTLFLLLICVTGLPLIFSAEIDRMSDEALPETRAAGTASADADAMIALAQQAFPSEHIRSVYWLENRPTVEVRLAPSDDADESFEHSMTFDARTGAELKQEQPDHGMKPMDLIRHLHEDLFVDLPGELFLGFMALLFLIAIISGVVLYAPFMRHVAFGQHRSKRTRLAWLDLHNTLSAVILAWAIVLGATGFINELATPLFDHWLASDLGQLPPGRAGESLASSRSPLSAVLREVQARLPERKIETVDFPTRHSGSPRHYIVWTKGVSPLTSRIYVPAFVDAVSGGFVMARYPPWYLILLEVSRPLHFGDYGGLPLKILWALFDILTIVVLVSGLVLWWKRRHQLASRRGQIHMRYVGPLGQESQG